MNTECDSLSPATLAALKTAVPPPPGVTYAGTGAPAGQVESASCGVIGTGKFVVNLTTSAVASCNVATLRDTGVTYLTTGGC